MKTKYIVSGSVRGTISQHNTISGAYRSMRRDQKSCKRLGGGAYSDVSISRADGSDLSEDESEEIGALSNKEYCAQ